VKSGETLYGIAQKHKTTVANIKRLNNMRGTTIKKGQVLRVK
jgi:N-acetylmuramoyl-L-alanine amidase